MSNPITLIPQGFDGSVYAKEYTIAAGQSVTATLFDGKAFAWSVYPDAGASVLVEFTTSSRARIADSSARFRSYGTLTAAGGDESLTPYTALRFTATSGNATVEIVQK